MRWSSGDWTVGRIRVHRVYTGYSAPSERHSALLRRQTLLDSLPRILAVVLLARLDLGQRARSCRPPRYATRNVGLLRAVTRGACAIHCPLSLSSLWKLHRERCAGPVMRSIGVLTGASEVWIAESDCGNECLARSAR